MLSFFLFGSFNAGSECDSIGCLEVENLRRRRRPAHQCRHADHCIRRRHRCRTGASRRDTVRSAPDPAFGVVAAERRGAPATSTTTCRRPPLTV